MAIPSTHPKIVYGANTLWIPRKFGAWDLEKSAKPEITQGGTYTQVATSPIIYTFKGTTQVFIDSSEAWIVGASAQLFITAWDSVWENWISKGKVFSFYRTATDSGSRSYFQRVVWTNKDDGLKFYTGVPRYDLTINFNTELVDR